MNFSACWLNLFADVFRFLFLGLRSRSSLAAENLFLRNSSVSIRSAESSPAGSPVQRV
jgi:hypothetical protein